MARLKPPVPLTKKEMDEAVEYLRQKMILMAEATKKAAESKLKFGFA
jgi:SpoU rRNA methylase family enzyme